MRGQRRLGYLHIALTIESEQNLRIKGTKFPVVPVSLWLMLVRSTHFEMYKIDHKIMYFYFYK